MKRASRFILIGLGAIFAALIVALVGGYLYLQSEAGKRTIERVLANALSSPDSTVTIEGLSGSIPFDLAVARITVSDRSGAWLEVENARLDIDSAALWRRELAIRQLTVTSVAVARTPEGAPEENPREPPKTKIDLSLPRLPVAITVAHMAIERIALAEPVLGQPATLTFSGQAALGGREANLRLNLARTDDIPGQANLALGISGDPAVLNLKLDASEPTGLLMKRLLDRDDVQPLTVTLEGAGPLSSWQGKLTGDVGELLAIESDVGVKQTEVTELSLAGSATQQDLAPASLQPLLGDHVKFVLDAKLDGDVVTLNDLTVTAAAAEVTGAARLDNETQAVTATAQVKLPDLKAAEALLGTTVAGQGQLDLKIEGSTAKPVLHAALTGNGIAIEDFGVASLDAALALEPDGSIDDEKTAWRIETGGHFTGLTQAGQPLPAGLGDAIEWSLAGKAAPSEQSIALDHLTAKGAGIDLAARGQVSPQAAAGTISLTVAELGAFGGLVKLPRMHGRLSIDGDVTTDDKGHITASLKGGAEEFGLGIQVADVILAPTISIDTAAERHEDGQISLSNLNVVTPTATVTGNANYAPDSDRLTGRLVANMPRLDPLEPAIRTSIRGDATVTADLGGSPDHPSLQARVESHDLNIESVPIRRLTAQLSVADLNQPSGTLSAAFDLAGIPTRLDTGYAMPNDDLLTVRKLILSAGAARLSGNIDYDLARDLASGKLAGGIPDLQPWSSLAGQALAGNVTISVNLVPREGQVAGFEVNGNDVKIGAAKDAILLSQIKLQGRGHNLTDNPAGKVTLDVAGIGAGDLRVDSLHVDTDIRSDSAIGFDGQAGGELMLAGEDDEPRRLPLTLDLAGDWSKGKDGQAITLPRFAAKLDKDEAKLLQPVTLSLGAVETRLTGLALDLAGGRINGDARLGKDRIALKLDAQKLPLEVAGRFLAQPLSGTLDIAADLDGSLAAPGGKVTIKGQDIKIADAEGAQIPPLDLTLALTPKAGQVAVNGEASMPDMRLLTVTGTLPLDLTAASAVDMIPAHRPMALKIDGDGRLQGLIDLLALGEDRLTGNYKVALTVGGTRAEPEVGGQLTLTDGRYLNQAFGTELRNIAATLKGDQSHLTLTQFSAQDPRGGNLTASGSIDLAASPAPLLAFKATLSSLRVANSDTARVTANGDIGINGSLTEPKVTANLTIPRAEFRIPDRLPPSVPTLDVIVIDSRDPHSTAQRLAEARRQAAKPRKAFRVAFDINVTIPGQTFVRGHGLESEWRGRIGITGDSNNPEIDGRLQTVRGTIDFLGKNFVIRRGVITFPTGRITDPRMEMLAEYNASDIVAQVSVTGSPTAPTLVLSSTPQLPQDEVLSRVLFGRDTGGITPAQGAQLALAANSLASGGPGIMDRLREGIGLDRLDFGSASTSPAAPPPSRSSGSPSGGSHTDVGPTVSGGKYIAPGVFVGLEQGTTPESSRAKVEVDITRGLTGYSSVGEQSNQVGVDWRMDY